MAKFITLSGKKQTGKDSAAKIIRQYLVSESFSFCLDNEGVVRLQSSVGIGPLGVEGINRVHVVHFADALKKACNIIFGIPLEDMETEEGKQKVTHVKWPCNMASYDIDQEPTWVPSSRYIDYCHKNNREINGGASHMTVREILQFVGTDLLRNQLDPDIWVESVFRQPWKEDDVVIIADARFPNEADIALQHGLLINIERETKFL